MDFVFYITLFLLILIFGSLDINIDYDFWARLIVGKSFFQTGSLFHNDFYSFGTTHSFIDHEWGSSLVFYLIQKYFDDIGLFFFKSILLFTIFFLIAKTIKLKNQNVKLHFLFFFLAIHTLTFNIFSTIRCQIFSFLFFVFYIYILENIRVKKKYRLLWTLPLLNIIWQNCHGGFVLGIALILLHAIGEYLNKKPAKPYILTFFTVCLTCFINPYGIEYITYIFQAFMLNRIHIPEWQSAFFNKNYFSYLFKFKVFFSCTVFGWYCYFINLIRKKQIKNHFQNIDKTKYLILIFTTLIALKAIRCHPFFIYCVLIFCYDDFNKLINQKLSKILDILFFILISISSISHLLEYKFVNKVDERFYPVNCVEFIKQNSLKGNIFTNFHTASYVAYKLYPNNCIFMDGRYEEVYDNSLINEMGRFFLAIDYKSFLNKYHFDILIMDKTYPKIIEILKSDSDWFLAYDEKSFSLFLPKKHNKEKFILPNKNNNQYNKEKFETRINW